MTPAATHLTEVHAARTSLAFEKSVKAIRDLEKTGEAVNFSLVARRAGVGRAFLYNTPELREEIERLRATTGSVSNAVPATQRGSAESLKARLRAVREENQRLREELAALKDELALAHGEARLHKRERRIPK